MRIFLLGATGRTGTEILDLALERGHAVTAFVRSPRKLTPRDRLTIVEGDVKSAAALGAALPEHDVVLSAIGAPPREALGPSTLARSLDVALRLVARRLAPRRPPGSR